MVFHVQRLALIGTGLINGSLALALKAKGAVGEVVGCARRPTTLERAQELGICDRATTDPRRAVEGADLVVIGTPPGAAGAVAAAMAPGLAAGAIVTDVGSVKAGVVAQVAPHLPDVARFVPGHPVAGTEHSVPDAAFATLFERRRCILTPLPESDPAAVATVRTM